MKALYDLKQSPRAWFEHFWTPKVSCNYIQSHADHNLFVKRRDNRLTALIVYVDNIIVTSNDEVEVEKLKCYLENEFEIKDLGKLNYFLGIEVAHSQKGIFISQQKYTLDLLSETRMLGCKLVDTLMDPNQKFKNWCWKILPTSGTITLSVYDETRYCFCR